MSSSDKMKTDSKAGTGGKQSSAALPETSQTGLTESEVASLVDKDTILLSLHATILAHPFIRYDTQDLVEVKDGRIIRIMGRQCETLLEADGQLLTVHNFTHYFADNFPSVDGWQIVREKNGNIRFRLVVNSLYTPDDGQRIVQHWSPIIGRAVAIELVDKLPLMGNNKHLSIIDEK